MHFLRNGSCFFLSNQLIFVNRIFPLLSYSSGVIMNGKASIVQLFSNNVVMSVLKHVPIIRNFAGLVAFWWLSRYSVYYHNVFTFCASKLSFFGFNLLTKLPDFKYPVVIHFS